MVDLTFVGTLSRASDARIPVVLGDIERPDRTAREWARSLRRLLTSYVFDGSAHHHGDALVPAIHRVLDALGRAQHADGTFSVGNLHSPPDSAFVIEDLGVLWSLASRDDHAATQTFAAAIGRIVAAAGPALVAGGVHTPNHRWALCAALAWIDRVAPDPAYQRRIEQWLAEGVDQDADGQYSERSPNYAARVTNPALLTLARLTDRPQLRDAVRRSLDFALWCADDDGAVESIASRRQDQDHRTVWLADFYLQFRELAGHDRDPRFAAAAALVERGAAISPDALTDILENPALQLPRPSGAVLPTSYTKVFAGSGLARLRRGRVTASVFAGTDDFERGRGAAGTTARRIGSGLSTNPTFLRLSNGAAVLESVRMTTSFFGLGHFRGDGLRVLGPGRFGLGDELRAAYYQPLAAADVRPGGDYELAYDGRFFAKMSFARRERHDPTLCREVVVGVNPEGAEAPLAIDVDFEVVGVDDVPVTVELCFRPGGSLTGVQRVGGTPVLVDGVGRYTAGEDWIEFGPGNGAASVDMDPGEQYRVHNGNRTPAGELAYITGRTPFRYTLRLRCS